MAWRQLNKKKRLRDVIDKVIVVAYQEDVSDLVSSFELEGFKVEISRPDYSPEEMTYSKNSRISSQSPQRLENGIRKPELYAYL